LFGNGTDSNTFKDNDGFVFGRFDADLEDWCMNLDYGVIANQLGADPASGGVKNFAFVTQTNGVVSNITLPRAAVGTFLQLCAHK
jgi:hypothetical protein